MDAGKKFKTCLCSKISKISKVINTFLKFGNLNVSEIRDASMKSETCLLNQRHLIPLISEAVKWKVRVSLISEAAIMGYGVSDFRDSEVHGQCLWFQRQCRGMRVSLISEAPMHAAHPMHYALCMMILPQDTMPYGLCYLAPFRQAPCHVDHWPCSIAPISSDPFPVHHETQRSMVHEAWCTTLSLKSETP